MVKAIKLGIKFLEELEHKIDTALEDPDVLDSYEVSIAQLEAFLILVHAAQKSKNRSLVIEDHLVAFVVGEMSNKEDILWSNAKSEGIRAVGAATAMSRNIIKVATMMLDSELHADGKACPRDTNGDGDCGRPACPVCGKHAVSVGKVSLEPGYPGVEPKSSGKFVIHGVATGRIKGTRTSNIKVVDRHPSSPVSRYEFQPPKE